MAVSRHNPDLDAAFGVAPPPPPPKAAADAGKGAMAEYQKAVREAIRVAKEAARESVREAKEAARESIREARDAAREKAREEKDAAREIRAAATYTPPSAAPPGWTVPGMAPPPAPPPPPPPAPPAPSGGDGFDLKAVGAVFAELRADMGRQAKGLAADGRAAMAEYRQAVKGAEREAKEAAKERVRADKEAEKELEREQKEADRQQTEAERKRAETVRAAFAAPTRAAELLRGGFNVLGTALGAVQTGIVNFVRLANPAAVLRFQLALDDLQAVIGKALTPALDRFTAVLRTIGGAVAGLSGDGKNLLASLAAGAVGMVAFAAGALLVQTVLTGGLLPILSAIGGALGGVVFVSGGFSNAIKDIGQIFAGVANQLGGVLSAFADSGAFSTIAIALAEVAGIAVGLGASLLEGLMPALNATAAVFKALSPLAQPLMELALLFNPMLLALNVMGPVIEEITPHMVAFAHVLAEVGATTARVVKDLLALIGITVPTAEAPRGTQGDSTGASVRSTGTSGVSEVLQKARESAYKLGTGGGADPATRSAGHLASIEREAGLIKQQLITMLNQLPGDIATAIRNAPSQAASAAASAVANSPAARGAVNGIVGPIGTAAMDLYNIAQKIRG